MTKRSAVQNGTNRSSKRTLSPLILLFLILTFGALACDLGDLIGGKPNAIITSPPSGSTFHEGEEIAVQSVSTDAQGILRVELIVDGQIVRADTAPSPQSQFTLVQTWQATQGTHTILVRAYNTQNTASDPAAISIQVSPSIAAAATNTPPSAVTSAPAVPTSTTAPGGPSPTTAPVGCTNNSAFVSDVTVPDGATINAGQTFNKIWRLSNNGTCSWGAGYQFVFVSGEAMTPNTVIPVPNTPPGGTADLLVPMTAPAPAGSHQGQWRIRSSAGALFGQTVSVKITVPGPPAPTATNTTAPSGCSGTPNIASFTGPAGPIIAGTSTTLNWGAVTNADSVEINQGIGGVGTPGSTTVTPGTTTTYTMTARCGANSITSQVVVTVVGNFAGHWNHNFGTMDLTQTGASVTGTYHNSFDVNNGTVAGTVSGNTLTGTYTIGGSGSILFTLGSGGNTFDGNWGGTQKWCGARSGVAFPSGCSFSGSWTINVALNPCTSMTLTRTDNSVSGTYCDGSVSGTVSYASGETTLAGTWTRGGSGTFGFYLVGYNGLQFRGNWDGANQWCGWRSSSSQPSPCKKP